MAFNDKTRFWVIFDTCTRLEYYKDVHNLLALPRGATIRYEYRKRWLSQEAVDAAVNPGIAPSLILLIYGQWKRYRKGDPDPDSSTPSSEILWVPTRIAEMQLIPPPEGENFFFDFKVLGYPKPDDRALMEILNPLIRSDRVPYHKWVSISNHMEALTLLREGRDEENWQLIVNCIGSPPMQFSGDSFWRVKALLHAKTGRDLDPKYEEEKRAIDSKFEIRKVTSFYELSESESYKVEVISHSPPQPNHLVTRPPRRLEIQVDKDSPLSAIGNTSFDLRSYTGIFVEIQAKRYAEIQDKIGTVTFRTTPLENGWPVGPSFSLRFRVKKKWEVIVGILFGVFGLSAIFYANYLRDKNITCAITLFLAGVFLEVIAGVLLEGKIKIRA